MESIINRNCSQELVHHGLAWVKIESTAVEVDGILVIFPVAEAVGSAIDGLNFAVDSFSDSVGNSVKAEADNIGPLMTWDLC